MASFYTQPAGDAPPEIIVEGLHKSFGEIHVLRGIDLTIRRGEFVAIVGPSGCGKTVLLDHIVGLLRPDAGRVLIADHERPGDPLLDLGELDEDHMDEIRRHWAVVFQRNALFSGTVYENIALWLREIERAPEAEIRRRAEQSLSAVGLSYEQVAQKDRDELSGGMAKRVAIARGISMNPRLLFYDEPTTGLDPQHTANIHELLAETHSRHLDGGAPRTSLVVTHDKDLLARIEPRIVMLTEGRVFFDGTYGEFEESDSPLIRPYLELMPVLQQRPALRA
ncbi:MAG: ABC transporter ATP-binding protein [Planctomycetota bacterium]|jgi:phospholipid/cholesterol/gamma-HCH transport system ATP-binding protein